MTLIMTSDRYVIFIQHYSKIIITYFNFQGKITVAKNMLITSTYINQLY